MADMGKVYCGLAVSCRSIIITAAREDAPEYSVLEAVLASESQSPERPVWQEAKQRQVSRKWLGSELCY